jgi:hypothetical protein
VMAALGALRACTPPLRATSVSKSTPVASPRSTIAPDTAHLPPQGGRTNDRYQFSIGEGGEDTVRITKFIGGKAQSLAIESVASLNATVVNRIRAECTNVTDAAQGAVRLVFSLNGQIVAEAIDSDQPLPDGTIGIRVFALGQTGIRAEFDNFVVAPV